MKQRAKLESKFDRFKIDVYKSRYLYIMLLPCIIWFIVFCYLPMGGLLLAFKEFRYTQTVLTSPWVGFKYFKSFFSYYEWKALLRNTLLIGFVKTVIAFPFPIIFALLMNEVGSVRCRKTIQTISYLPHFISWAVVVALVMRVLAPDTGILNQIKGALGLESDTFYLMEENYFYPIMFLSYIWKTIGWNSIIYFAAITGIDPQLYEAARIDGAKKFKQIWHITVPCIRSTMGILLIMSVGGIIKTGFEQIYLLRTPGNMRLADILDTYIIRSGIKGGEYGYATAVGLMTSIVGLFMVIITNKVCKKYMEVSVW